MSNFQPEQSPPISPEQPSKPLICAECEHSSISTYEWQNSRCFAPENIDKQNKNLVTGQTIYIYPFCVQARENKSVTTILADSKQIIRSSPNCGPEGQWFKAKLKNTDPPAYIEPAKKKVNLKDVTADDL